MKKVAWVIGGLIAAMATAASISAQALELKMLTSWPPNNTGTRVTELAFMAMVPEVTLRKA